VNVPPDEETRALREDEWAVPPGQAAAPPPPVPPPDARPAPPPGPPRGWLAVENPWPWLLLVLVAVAALLIWLFAFRGHSDRAQVPRVLGLTQQAAVAKLNDAGFPVKSVVRAGPTPRGRVFAQIPGSGTQLKKGQQVSIAVSNGSPPKASPGTTTTTATTTAKPVAPPVAVPDVTGKPMSQAGAAIETAGLVPDTFAITRSEPPGTVVSQDPSAGTKLAAGKSVRLDVSNGGSTVPEVAIPNVTGQKAADARSKLWAAKLTTHTVYESGDAGIVLRQEPSGGLKRVEFTQVTLHVGR
jgi:beta-lactam-binding protein with PASTA domain